MYQNDRVTVASSQDAATSFTTAVNFQNFDTGAIQIDYVSFAAETASVQLNARAGGSTSWAVIASAVTLVSSASAYLFNFTGGSIGFEEVQVVYKANGETTGTINVKANRKSLR